MGRLPGVADGEPDVVHADDRERVIGDVVRHRADEGVVDREYVAHAGQ